MSSIDHAMAAAGVEELPPTETAPPSAAIGDGDATAQADVDDTTTTTNTNTNAAQDQDQDQDQELGQDNSTAPVSNTASASATASPSPVASAADSPPRIVSDIPSAVSNPQGPGTQAPPATAPVASPALSASPSVHGLGARPGLKSTRSTSNTPQHSPALPSPPVPLRHSPAATQPPPAAATASSTRASDYQNNPVWRSQPPLVYRKLPIAPAPAPAPSSPAPVPASGFPSPGRDRIHADPKFLDDKTRITFGIQQAIPEAVRRSVRDNWEACLLGSEFHQAFVVGLILSPLSLSSCHHALTPSRYLCACSID